MADSGKVSILQIDFDVTGYPQGPIAAMVAAKFNHQPIRLVGVADASPSTAQWCTLTAEGGKKIFGSFSIAQYFWKKYVQKKGLQQTQAWNEDESNSVIEFVLRHTQLGRPDALVQAVSFLNTVLVHRSFVLGPWISAADLCAFEAIRLSVAFEHVQSVIVGARFPDFARWWAQIEAFPEYLSATRDIASAVKKVSASAAKKEPESSSTKGAAAKGGAKGGAPAAAAGASSAKSADAGAAKDAVGSTTTMQLILPDAEMGKVVTRFPPEASGYLHVGHAKAALINDYFARNYNGKLIVRFDDTNPVKEKREFEENILQDVERLGLKPDVLTYSSDHFDYLLTAATDMVKNGKAYVDATPVEQLREERMVGTESVYRGQTIEENLKLWKEMQEGTETGLKCVLRAKIDMSCKNKAMRDPVLYRCNLEAHPRTGTTYKVYPTYDFTVPLVDSREGVTHALRTSEYHDRNDQYFWICDAAGVRKPVIYDYSRLNFVRTVLSKRKLTWFVNNGYVEGWDDPRFPTVQGLLRRGLQVEALREFVLQQGASKNCNLMEWDKIWSINKSIIDPKIPRFAALLKKDIVHVEIDGAPVEPEVKLVLRHKKNADLGKKTVTYFRNVLLDQEDATQIEDNEEVTLMDWGNVIMKTVHRDADGKVVSIKAVLHLEGDFRKTKKKLTWLADVPSLCPVTLVDLGDLLTKDKIEEDEDFFQFVNKNTWAESAALADGNVFQLKKGEIFQFERRGYFICDRPYLRAERPAVMLNIPDGKQVKKAAPAKA